MKKHCLGLTRNKLYIILISLYRNITFYSGALFVFLVQGGRDCIIVKYASLQFKKTCMIPTWRTERIIIFCISCIGYMQQRQLQKSFLIRPLWCSWCGSFRIIQLSVAKGQGPYHRDRCFCSIVQFCWAFLLKSISDCLTYCKASLFFCISCMGYIQHRPLQNSFWYDPFDALWYGPFPQKTNYALYRQMNDRF